MNILLTYFILALIISFICSLLESVLLSVDHSHIAVLLRNKKRSGHLLRDFKEFINRPLSAILTLNTIANTIGAAGVGAEALKLYGSKWVALASGTLTLSILVFSEVVPKTLGAIHWKKLLSFAAHSIRILIVITYPFVIMLEFISRLLTPSRKDAKVTREDVLAMAEMGEDEGTFHEKETRIIENIIKLDKIYAEDVLTPRSVIYALQKNLKVGDVMGKNKLVEFSRIPIYGSDMDDMVGIVYRYDLLNKLSEDAVDTTLESIMTPVYTVQQSDSVASILDKFIQRREHMFIVLDEFGGTAGIITLEDAIETLLGVEIMDESDSVEDMRKFAREKWRRKRQK